MGSTQNGTIIHVGYAGSLLPFVEATGQQFGNLSISEARWSPDGRWLVYTLRRDGQVQLWRSDVRQGRQEQLTNNAADVQGFAWSEDAQSIYYVTGETRAAVAARDKYLRDTGYNYNDDINAFTDFMRERIPSPTEGTSNVWTLDLQHGRDTAADDVQRAAFQELQKRSIHDSQRAAWIPPMRSAAAPRMEHVAWLEDVADSRAQKRVAVSAGRGWTPKSCYARECTGFIERLWWSGDGRTVFFLRHEGLALSGRTIYAWSPLTSKLSGVFRSLDDHLANCSPGPNDELICIREAPSQPSQVVAISCTTGRVRIVVDLNPEFSRARLGRVERFEWHTPSFDWSKAGERLAGAYEDRAYGYLYLPPDFDASKKYPVFIDPYGAPGFESSLGLEHSYHVYAANGFIVVNTFFPGTSDEVFARLGADLTRELYSPVLHFPHLSMLAESTIRGLDTIIARGFADSGRVGIGGVSHGTFVPLYIVQKHDRLAAVSISSPHWSRFQYYWSTRKLRQQFAAQHGSTDQWLVKPDQQGEQFWSGIDIADHVDEIEAPILMQLADQETFSLLRLIRHMDDAAKPYDAYVFPHETHIKWQPAHIRSILQRNLAWFRFWLQDDESAAVSGDEYNRWRQLRKRYLSDRAVKPDASASQ